MLQARGHVYDNYEREILGAYEKGRLKSVATKAKIDKLREAALTTAINARRPAAEPAKRRTA